MLQVQRKFWGKRPGFDFGDVMYLVVTVGFAAALYVLVRYLNLAFIAAILILLSKWRVLAVQPRFWLPNIKANLVDAIVGLSTVALMNQAQSNTVATVWALLFALWLLVLKPRATDSAVAIQALWAQFIGLTTIFMSNMLLEISFLALALVLLVSWSAARHFFGNYEEPHYKTLSYAWAFIVAQFAWLGLHWIHYYQFFGLKISTVPLLVSVVALTGGLLYHSLRKNDQLQRSVVIENTVFGLVLVVLILLTSSWTTSL